MTDLSAQRPEDIRFLSGLILVSEQPERLVDLYRDVLGLPLAEERHGDTAPHWACELGDVHFAIHPVADYQGEPTATGAVKLAFMIFDMTGLVQWLETRGVPLCYPPTELGTQSRITAIRDPDGNWRADLSSGTEIDECLTVRRQRASTPATMCSPA